MVSADITTVVDPELDLTVLLPWATADNPETVQDVISEIADDLIAWNPDLGYEDDVVTSLYDDVRWALPDEPLAGWSVTLSERTLSLSDGQTAPFSVLFSTPTPGAIAFAIQGTGVVRDPETGEETVERIVSEIMVLDVGPELGQVTFGQL